MPRSAHVMGSLSVGPSSAADEFLTVTPLTSSVEWVLVLRVVGEVDLITVERLREHLYQHVRVGGAHRVIVLDCTQVSFLAACGIGLLAEIADKASAEGMMLRLVVESPRLLRILEVTGAGAELPLAATVAEAIAHCQA